MVDIHNWIEIFVYLVEDVVSEKLDYVSIASFRPTMRSSEPDGDVGLVRMG